MRLNFRALAFLAMAILGWAEAAPLAMGTSQVEMPNGSEPVTLFTYKPPTYTDGPLLIVFHGVGRNAEEYRNFAITMAERFKAIVVAPMFDQ